MRRALFGEAQLRTAGELLDALLPHRGGVLHDRDRIEWIFRGQEEAACKLQPAAFRVDDVTGEPAFVPFAGDAARTRPRTVAEQITHEFTCVAAFAYRASECGMEVPYDGPELRDPDAAGPPEIEGKSFPPVIHRGMFALAQHYGVPTRLLDWTTKPLVAAYFAAVKAAQRRAYGRPMRGSNGRLAVFALSRDFVTRDAASWDPGPTIVTVPGSSNPNLAVQGGLFTLVRYVRREPRRVVPPTLDDLFRQHEARGAKARGPALVKLTVPHEEAGKLLFLLHALGVDAASVFPSHRAVVDALRERRLYEPVRPRARVKVRRS